MSVKLLRPWLKYESGAVIDLGLEVNAKLVESGKAEDIEPQRDERAGAKKARGER